MSMHQCMHQGSVLSAALHCQPTKAVEHMLIHICMGSDCRMALVSITADVLFFPGLQ